MKRVSFIALFFATFFSTATAQYFPVDTALLNKTYRKLLKNPQSRELQLDFFKAFPDTWDDFNSTYKYSDKEGYDLSMYSQAYEHIKALAECYAINDTLYCNKLIALSVGPRLTPMHQTICKDCYITQCNIEMMYSYIVCQK